MPGRFEPHSTIAWERKQSLIAESSNCSICFVPFRRRCSMELTLRGETLEALKWKVYRTNRRNFGRTASGLLLAIRSALTIGLSWESHCHTRRTNRRYNFRTSFWSPDLAISDMVVDEGFYWSREIRPNSKTTSTLASTLSLPNFYL